MLILSFVYFSVTPIFFLLHLHQHITRSRDHYFSNLLSLLELVHIIIIIFLAFTIFYQQFITKIERMLLLTRRCKWIQDNIRLWAATYPYFALFEIIVYIRKLGRHNHWWTKWGNHPWKNPPHCLFGLGYYNFLFWNLQKKCTVPAKYYGPKITTNTLSFISSPSSSYAIATIIILTVASMILPFEEWNFVK